MKYNKITPKDNMKLEKEEVVEEVQRPRPARVLDEPPVERKKSLTKRLVQGTLGPDGFRQIGNYVVNEIIVPTIQNVIFDSLSSGVSMIAESLTAGINMAIYGEDKPIRRNRGSLSEWGARNIQKTDYTSRYGIGQSTRAVTESRNADVRATEPRRYKYVADYPISNRTKAAEVLQSLIEHADAYDTVSVADYYDTIGVVSDFTDNNWGWTIDTIVKSTILPTRGGFIIEFPPVSLIV